MFDNLCSMSSVIGVIAFDDNIYVFTIDKTYIFNGKSTFSSLFGELIADDVIPSKKWTGFNPTFGGFFAIDNNLCVIIDNNNYSCWNSKGEVDQVNEPIDEYDRSGDEDDAGALIPIVINLKYAKITDGDKVCYLTIRDNKCYKEICMPIMQEENNFPPNIVAAFNSSDGNFYFVDKNGKYCKRLHNDKTKVFEYILNMIKPFIIMSMNIVFFIC